MNSLSISGRGTSNKIKRFATVWFLVVIAASCHAQDAAKTGDDPLEPRLVLQEATLKDLGTVVRYGKFRVWEDRESQAGRILELDVVVLPAFAQNPCPDPVFYFAGGPGQAAATLHRGWARHWMRQDRDIVFVSQRGTGGTNKLSCELPANDDNLQGYLDPLFDAPAFKVCLEDLQQRFDLSKYSTSIAMDDVNDLRQVLGYEKINLYGGSYGSRAELVYIRRHPQTVRTAILNSVAPMAFTNPLFHARGAQDALDMLFERCEGSAACREIFGDIRGKFEIVLEQLEAEPARTSVKHPVTAEQVPVTLSREAFAEALRIIMYYDTSVILKLIDQAFNGDYSEIAQRGMERSRSLGNSLAMGMLLCVTCSEDVARIDPHTIGQYTDGTFLGDHRVRQQMAICEFWPKSDIPADYGQPVTSDVPVLFLSGQFDPVTPPLFGELAVKNHSRGLHVVAPGAHGIGGPCIESIMRAVLETGRTRGVDTSCVKSMTEQPFRFEK